MLYDIFEEYCEYLENIVCNNDAKLKRSYKRLFNALLMTEFKVQPDFPMDENRLMAGLDLRTRFKDSYGYSMEQIRDTLNFPCSIFEMMIALSIYIEESVMDNPSYGNRTAQWFWGMIASLGLGSQDDKHFDNQATVLSLQNFLNRKYDYNGKGGLFTLEHPDCDMTTIEIWWQATRYLDEQLIK